MKKKSTSYHLLNILFLFLFCFWLGAIAVIYNANAADDILNVSENINAKGEDDTLHNNEWKYINKQLLLLPFNERSKRLKSLYQSLKITDIAAIKVELIGNIRKLRIISSSDTINLLIERSFLLSSTGRFDDALELLSSVNDTDPTFAEAWYLRASILQNLKQYEKAKHGFETVLKLEKNHFDAIYNLGKIYYSHNQNDKVIEFWKKIIHLNEAFPDLAEKLDEVYKEINSFEKL